MAKSKRWTDHYRGRLLAGRSMTAMSQKAGVSLPHVSLILAGRRAPSLDVAARLAKAARMDLTTWHRVYQRLLSLL